MTPEQLDAIQGPLDAAMCHAPYKVVNGAFGKKVVQANNHPSLRPYVLADNLAPIIAEFIATAPENMTALLAYARDLEARIGRVDELHLSSGGHNPKCQCGIPAGDGATCLECGDIWPCPTIAALTATEAQA